MLKKNNHHITLSKLNFSNIESEKEEKKKMIIQNQKLLVKQIKK